MTELVPTGGGLPYSLELPTGKVMDILLGVLPTDKTRKQVNDWLYRNSKPRFSTPLGKNSDLYLTYLDQRDGHGTPHWWRLFFGDRLRSQIEELTKSNALVVSQSPSNQANSGVRAPYEWFGMYFRSKVEMKVAKELHKRGITFFANARGCYSLDNSPISRKLLNGRIEIDFLVFHRGKCAILQVDGPQYQGQRERDYAGDRILLKQGIPGKDCRCRDRVYGYFY